MAYSFSARFIDEMVDSMNEPIDEFVCEEKKIKNIF